MIARLKRAGDEGAALILVLVIITVLALGIGGLLTLGDASMRATVALRGQTTDVYLADGAADAAINAIRNSTYNGSAGTNCFPNGTDSLPLNGFYGSQSATVTCSPSPSSVLIHCPTLSNCNRPSDAILTLGDVSGEDGINISTNSGSNPGSAFRVHGVVYSHSNINVPNGTLDTNANVYAVSQCQGTIVTTGTKYCNDTGPAADQQKFGSDPGYTPESSTVPPYQSMDPAVPGTPAYQCAHSPPKSIITFHPGYYDDAQALSDLMDGNSHCKGSTWWFEPGHYYFDFHNYAYDANGTQHQNTALPSGDDVWTIDDGYLVAGTPTGSLTPPVTVPGACENPIYNDQAKGVQFVFGGDSRLLAKSARAEICGTYSTNAPPVAVYGLSSGSETKTTLSGGNALAPAAASSANDDFTGSPSGTSLIDAISHHSDSTFATWQTTGKNRSASLTATGFSPGTAIPAGSNVLSADAVVYHRFTPGPGKSSEDPPTLTGTLPDGTSLGSFAMSAYDTADAPGFMPDSVDVAPGLAPYIHAHGLTTSDALALTYTATQTNGTEDVDSIALEITYTKPAYEAATGCLTQTPFTSKNPGSNSNSPCAIVQTVNAGNSQATQPLFYVQGTTYVPAAAVDIEINSPVEQVFRFGVISRTLWATLNGQITYLGPVIEVPDDSPGVAFSVYLNVYVCDGSGPCSTTGTPGLTTRVAFIDAYPGTPTAGARQVQILSWSNTR